MSSIWEEKLIQTRDKWIFFFLNFLFKILGKLFKFLVSSVNWINKNFGGRNFANFFFQYYKIEKKNPTRGTLRER